MKFPCHMCGACCMMVGQILAGDYKQEYRELVKKFPYKADEKGWCEKLGKDLKCTVYNKRPPLCRIDYAYDRLFLRKKTRKQYYDETSLACRWLMEDKLGMSKTEIDKVYEQFN